MFLTYSYIYMPKLLFSLSAYTIDHLLDKDREGSITIKELGTVLRSLGENIPEDDLRDMVSEADADGNEHVDFPEFLSMITRRMKSYTETEMKDAFHSFDMEDNKFISVVDLRNVMETIGEKLSDGEVQDMIHVADIDGDGRVSYEDFVNMMNQKNTSFTTIQTTKGFHETVKVTEDSNYGTFNETPPVSCPDGVHTHDV